ncbi:MAG: chloride channel protein [Microcoleaceae cyanobacterium]
MGQLFIPEQLPKQLKALAFRILQPTSPKNLAIVQACIIGFVSGLAAFCLREGAGWLGSQRVHGSLSTQMPVWVFLPLVGVIGGFLTGLGIERFAPEATGSGIPQVKAALGGLPISLDLRVAIAKLLGTMFTMGSGLTLGRQGPTVQIGAALAAWISRWVPTSPNYRRQMLASGAAAGLSAGFNAPIAGVLFVVEDLLHDISGVTLGPAIIASFIGSVVSRLLGGRDLSFNPPSPEALEASYRQWLIEIPEIPFYIILGVLAGVLGTLFSTGIVKFIHFNHHVLKLSLPARMALSGLLCGLIISGLPVDFRNNSGLREFILNGDISWKIAALAFVAHFALTTIAASSSAPGGLFAPSLVLGASLGELIGLWQSAVIGLEPATTFALAGMGAFFCAVSRTPITSVVIVFEITEDFNLVLQLMICSIVAFFTAEQCHSQSLYDRLLQLSGIQLKPDQSVYETLSNIQASDVMQRHVETLDSYFTLDQARLVFSESRHRGFPVVKDGKLVGIFTQQDLADIAKRQVSGDTPISQLMTPQPITVNPKDSLSQVLYMLTKYRPSRLPVVEGRHLVGIITRSDIIKAELGYLSGEATQVGPHPHPSYVVYQTRAPQVGQGRLLVSAHNPQTVAALLQIAAAIARERNYELECLHVITVPLHRVPSETSVRLKKSRRLLQQADRVGQAWQVPVHTQARVSHDVAHAILETIKERHIDLVLMGWQGEPSAPNRIFGNVVDTIVRQAPCEVMLVKWAEQSAAAKSPGGYPLSWNRWLLPLRGGEQQSLALKLIPAFVRLSVRPEVRLLRVVKRRVADNRLRILEQVAEKLQQELKISAISTVVCNDSIAEAVIDMAEKNQCDVVVLGASQESLLQQVIQGNIPAAITRGCRCNVFLVRPALRNPT